MQVGMNDLLTVLRTSTDNATRREASSKLRHLQEEHPREFLTVTWDGIASQQLAPEDRFFLCTTVIAFVESSWHNAVPLGFQTEVLQRYLQLALSEHFASTLLARKVGIIVALMSRRGAGKPAPGGLPPLVEKVTQAYSHVIGQHNTELTPTALATLAQVLLLLHIFLKEMQTRRVGSSFERVCGAVAGPVSTLFIKCSSLSPLEHYDIHLYLVKCAMRVFGCGLFDAPCYEYLLDMAWSLAMGLGTDATDSFSRRRIRLLEYLIKVQEKFITHFILRLGELPLDFLFLVEDGCQTSGGSRSLLHLLCAIIDTPLGIVSEKLVCRSLRALTFLFSAEDGDDHVAKCLYHFAASPLLPKLVERLVLSYFPDDTSPERLQEWSVDPERVAGELDVDMDDESAASACAEQLFLALTGSSTCAEPSLAAAWSVVNRLLAEGGDGEVTAALHAIGIGYCTMAERQEQSNYVAFLRDKLLPIIYTAAPGGTGGPQASPFVLRRVVWLVGMWCESVRDVAHRRAVHEALHWILQQPVSLVVTLVTLHSAENFVSDHQFTLDELPPTYVPSVLAAVQNVLPQLRSPSSVKGLAALVHILIGVGAIVSGGSAVIHIFVPAVLEFIQKCEKVGCDGEADDVDDMDRPGVNMGSLSLMLECLCSAVSICSEDAAIWGLLAPVVVPCTTPGKCVTPWAEDYTWELLLTMARSSTTYTDAANEGLQWALRHTSRDFADLHIVLRTVYTFILLRQHPVEDVCTAEQVQTWAHALVESPSPELTSAYFAVLAVTVRLSAGPLRVQVMQFASSCLTSSDCVQSVSYTIPALQLIFLCLQYATPSERMLELLATLHSSDASLLVEQLVLLQDISPSELTSQWLARVLVQLHGAMILTDDDVSLLLRTVEGATMPTAGEEDGLSAETRTPAEMLLEMFGDEEVRPGCPHTERLTNLFADTLV